MGPEHICHIHPSPSDQWLLWKGMTMSNCFASKGVDNIGAFQLPVLSCLMHTAVYFDHNSLSSCPFRMINDSYERVCGRAHCPTSCRPKVPMHLPIFYCRFWVAGGILPIQLCILIITHPVLVRSGWSMTRLEGYADGHIVRPVAGPKCRCICRFFIAGFELPEVNCLSDCVFWS